MWAPVTSPCLSSCISMYMKLALSFGQSKGRLSFCNLCLPYGSLLWIGTIVYSILPQGVGLFWQGPRPHLSAGPKQCPLHRLNRRTYSRVPFPPSSPTALCSFSESTFYPKRSGSWVSTEEDLRCFGSTHQHKNEISLPNIKYPFTLP